MTRGPKRIVVLSYYYPPSPAVGGLRASKITRAFQEAGHDVVVITACLPGEVPGVRQQEQGLTVRTVTPLRNFRDWYAGFKRRRTARDPTAVSSPGQQPWAVPARVPFWKRFIFSLIWLPDAFQGFIAPAVGAARPELRDQRSMIYTTAPPWSVHLAGLWLHWRTGRPWIAEFRDPWTDNLWKPWHVRTALSEAVERWMERRVLGNADRIVAVSSGIERVFKPKMKDPTDRLLLVRNGIDRLVENGPAPMPAGQPLRILHVGTFYYGRDPLPFLRGFAAVCTRRGLTPAEVRVDLVGNCRWFRGLSIEKEVQKQGIAPYVQFEDWVPHARAQEMVATADVLLLLAQNQPDQVPNKLYEYLGTRRPILAFADQQGESAQMLREIGGHEVVTDEDPAAIEEALERLLQPAGDRQRPNEALLRSWTSGEQMGLLLRKVEDL